MAVDFLRHWHRFCAVFADNCADFKHVIIIHKRQCAVVFNINHMIILLVIGNGVHQ
ncbi:hypothetical protein SDC9_160871 [bioreactor metagenome]|uniref:Uncharacterized protein n=1 Tax=bioreactor metagenome TaxID=1076179 RepID=A0A645FHW2_9ZZZZ